MNKREVIKEEILVKYVISGMKKLPSETALANEFQVHRNTISVVLKELKHSGVIYPIQGKGWFIKNDAIANRTIDNAKTTYLKSRKKYKVILHETCNADFLSDIFNCNKYRKLGHYKRIHYNENGSNVRIEEKYYNRSIFGELTNEDISYSLRGFLKRKGISLELTNTKFFVCDAPKEITDLLDLPEGTTLLCTLEKVNDSNGNTVLYGIDYFKESEVDVNFNHFT